MGYDKTTWNPGAVPGISAANLNHLETQYDEAIVTSQAQVDAHKDLATGVHGAGASVLATAADIATHAALATHLVSGLIVMWHGLIANIPAGFVICDGNNSTPNLLTKFVQGVVTAATNPGAVGGAATHTLSVAELPAHHHREYSGIVTIGEDNTFYQSVGRTRTPNDTFIDTGDTGGDGAHENEPTFYDIAFIMKT